MYSDLQQTLTDPRFDWNTRLLRLQGWRGDQVKRATASGGATRVAPAFCAIGSLVAAALASPALTAFLAASALVGAVASHHPAEFAVNAVAGRRGTVPLPANRAAKKLGCAMGALLLGGATLAFGTGHQSLGAILACAMGATASFVAVTNICVPSGIFTVLWGTELAQAPSLTSAIRTRARASMARSGPRFSR
jgi:hypothetical protein